MHVVEGEPDHALPAQFCFGANASAAPATSQTLEIVPEHEPASGPSGLSL